MKLSLSLRIRSNLELIKIFFNHINNRWKLSTEKVIGFALSILFMLSVPILSNYLYSPDTEIESTMIILVCFMIELVVFLLMYCSFNRTKIEEVGKEISYSTKTFKFILSSYNKIIDRYGLLIPKYKYFFAPIRRIEELDLIVANLVLLKIYELYFKNIDKYGPSTVRYIPATVVTNLINNKEFKEFYSVLFFDPKLKGKKTHYDALVVNVLDAVVTELYTKDWFTEYYDPDKIDMIINTILEQWSYLAIQYNLNIEDYFITKK
jgi:hypothetical protein